MNAFQLMMQLIPTVENAVTAICAAEGKTPEQAFNDIISHLTPGQPNSPTLSAPPAPAKS